MELHLVSAVKFANNYVESIGFTEPRVLRDENEEDDYAEFIETCFYASP